MSLVFTEQEKHMCGIKYVSSNSYLSERQAEERAINLRERGYDAIVEKYENEFHVMINE